jgi:hypothetical protein
MPALFHERFVDTPYLGAAAGAEALVVTTGAAAFVLAAGAGAEPPSP